jgi:LysM repeat protein
MGCIIGGNIKNSSINIDQDPILTSKRIKQTLTIHNLFENPPSISSSILNHINNNNNNQRKSLFCDKKINSNNNLVKAKTNSSTILLNISMELIMKFSKELNENYEIISIFENNLKNLKDETIKITKEDPLHAIFSFGGEIKGKIKKDNSSLVVEECFGEEYDPPSNINTFNYTVVSGDSLYKIANRFNTSVSEILNLNKLSSSNLSIGQILKIPGNNTNVNTNKTYTVQKNDSLYSIAKKFNTTVDNLKAKNKLTSNNLSIGQIIYI